MVCNISRTLRRKHGLRKKGLKIPRAALTLMTPRYAEKLPKYCFRDGTHLSNTLGHDNQPFLRSLLHWFYVEIWLRPITEQTESKFGCRMMNRWPRWCSSSDLFSYSLGIWECESLSKILFPWSAEFFNNSSLQKASLRSMIMHAVTSLIGFLSLYTATCPVLESLSNQVCPFMFEYSLLYWFCTGFRYEAQFYRFYVTCSSKIMKYSEPLSNKFNMWKI